MQLHRSLCNVALWAAYPSGVANIQTDFTPINHLITRKFKTLIKKSNIKIMLSFCCPVCKCCLVCPCACTDMATLDNVTVTSPQSPDLSPWRRSCSPQWRPGTWTGSRSSSRRRPRRQLTRWTSMATPHSTPLLKMADWR